VVQQGQLEIERIAGNAVAISRAGAPPVMIGVGLVPAQAGDRGVERVLGSLADVGPDASPEQAAAAITDWIVWSSGGRLTLLAAAAPGLATANQPLLAASETIEIVEPEPAWVGPAAAITKAAVARDTAEVTALLERHEGGIVARTLIALIAVGDLDTATWLGDAALARERHREVLHQLAILATLRDDLATAEQLLREAIADPPHPPSLVNLAIALSRRGEHAEAITCADRALELMPDDPLARKAAVMLRAHAARFDDARTKLELVSGNDRVALELLIERLARGELDEAAMVATFPGHAEIAARRARELVDAEQWDDAIGLLERARTLDPTSLEIAGELGYALGKAGRDADAIAHYDRAIESVPGGPLLRLNRGNARRRLDQLDAAIDDYRHLVDTVPQLVDAHVALVATLAQAGRHDEARTQLAVLEARGDCPADVLAALRASIT
jgi:tetratricopeptide (TPR) repeat protein